MIYIRGDTHGHLPYFSDEKMPGQSAWTERDKLIVTGDFGFVFHSHLAERNNLDALSKKPYEILFLDGNHENFDLLQSYPPEERYGGPVRRIRDNIFWLQRGNLYTIEEQTFFVMGGGYSIDKALRLNYEKISREKVWFAQEMPSSEEYHHAITTLERCGMKMDYILTHTAPSLIIPRVIGKKPDPHEEELNGFLTWIYQNADFKKWFFGHFHEDIQINDQMIACYEYTHCLGKTAEESV